MTKTDIWMPIYIGDYMADTMHLTTEQHGAYLLLLMAAWKAGGNLPVSDRKLSVIARLPLGKWEELKEDILDFFDREGDSYTQKRLKNELSRARRHFESRRENGKKGGRPKKETEEKPTGFDSDNRDHNRDHNRGETPSPSPSHINNTGVPSGTPPRPAVENGGPPVDNSGAPVEKFERVPHQRIVDLYHEILPELPAVKLLNDNRKAGIRRLHRGVMRQDLVNWEAYFRRVLASDFLMGRVKPWRADFDFLLRNSAVTGVIEGKYHDQGQPAHREPPNERGLSSLERTRLARERQRAREQQGGGWSTG